MCWTSSLLFSSYHARTLGPVSFDLCSRGGEACKAEQREGVPCMREVGHFITGIRPLPLESVQIVKSITLGMRTDSESHHIWKVYR